MLLRFSTTKTGAVGIEREVKVLNAVKGRRGSGV